MYLDIACVDRTVPRISYDSSMRSLISVVLCMAVRLQAL